MTNIIVEDGDGRREIRALPFTITFIAPNSNSAPTFELTSNTSFIGSSAAVVGYGTWDNIETVKHNIMRDQDVLVANVANGYEYSFVAEDDSKPIYVLSIGYYGGSPKTATSMSIIPVFAPPATLSSISAKEYTQGTGNQTFDASDYFSGDNLTFSISFGDIDPSTGIVNFSTASIVEDANVVITATNSGGFAEQTFVLSVTAGEAPEEPTLAAIQASEVLVTFEVDPQAGTGNIPANGATWMFEILSGPALAATGLAWHGNIATPGMVPGAGFHPTIPHPTTPNKWIARAYDSTNPNVPGIKSWLWMNQGNQYDRINVQVNETLIWSADENYIYMTAGYSTFSETLTQIATVTGTEIPEEPNSINTKRLPMMYPADLAVGMLPNDQMQNLHGLANCRDYPDIVYGNQDSGGLWKSYDHGRTWRKFGCRGLMSTQGLGVVVDPANPNHVFANMGGSYEGNKPNQGIYRSIDGGANFTKIVASTLNARRGTHNSIGFAPASGLVNGRTKNIIAIVDGQLDNTTETQMPVRVSSDGGDNWSSKTNWDKNTYGSLQYIVGDSSNNERFYVTGSKGLVRISNAFGTITYTVLGGTGNLPAGSSGGPAYVSADGNTIIVGMSNKGVYKTTNGTAATPTWTKVGTFTDFDRLWVSPYNPNRMVGTAKANGSQQPSYSTNGGTTFTKVLPANVGCRPSAEDQQRLMIGDFTACVWHNDGSIFLQGRQTSAPHACNQYRSSDLINWALVGYGYCGSNGSVKYQSWAMFETKDRWVMPYVDLGPKITLNGGLSFLPNNIMNSEFTLSDKTCHGAVVGPNGLIMAAIQANNPKLLRSTDDGATWSAPTVSLGGSYTIVKGASNGVWFAGRYKSTNSGATWNIMNSLSSTAVVCGSTLDSSVIFAHDLRDTTKIFWRSTDEGNTWTLILTMPYSLQIPGSRWGGMHLHPTDGNYIFTRGPQDWNFRRWNLNSGTHNSRSYDDFNIFGSGTPAENGYQNSPITMSKIAIDPLHTEVWYAGMGDAGDTRIFRTVNSGSTWEELDEDWFPLTASLNILVVSPFTGDLIVGGSNGNFVIKRPYVDNSLPPSIFDSLPYDSYIGAPSV